MPKHICFFHLQIALNSQIHHWTKVQQQDEETALICLPSHYFAALDIVFLHMYIPDTRVKNIWDSSPYLS